MKQARKKAKLAKKRNATDLTTRNLGPRRKLEERVKRLEIHVASLGAECEELADELDLLALKLLEKTNPPAPTTVRSRRSSRR